MEKTNLIKRTKRTANFTIIGNELLTRTDISFEAKGFLCYVLSLPDDWVLHKTHAMSTFKIGHTVINRIFKELENVGYVAQLDMIEMKRDKGKFIGKNYLFYDEPIKTLKSEKFTDDQKPLTVKPLTDEPLTVNGQLLSTNSKQELKEKSTNKERGASTTPASIYSFLNGKEIEKKKKAVARHPSQKEVFDMFEKICSVQAEWKDSYEHEKWQFYWYYEPRDFELSGGKQITAKNLHGSIVSWMHRINQHSNY